MENYSFIPKKLPVISGYDAVNILREIDNGVLKSVNLSLGKYEKVPASVNDSEKIVLEWVNEKGKPLLLELEIEQLKAISRKEYRVYAIYPDGSLMHLGYFIDNNYYQLIAVDPYKAPTIEINGIRMHKTKGVSPLDNAKQKVRRLRIRQGMKVLDICTGLGYTAILASNLGGHVTSIEKDINVLKMAEFNPWSEELSSVKILLGDATEIIKEIEDNSYERIMNDPPRFSVAGELYSLEFFREVYRVLKPGGIFFQYTGFPQEKYRGKSIVKGIGERLRAVGFITRFDATAEGFICRKPKLSR